ncbi:ThiF family adenylyltransferase [Methanosphaera sp. ISO3-F5]|uniref:HesA/MoeB/ThiF family protein n=1 Tax=Methanosphaera sp. ISO3-F5 TaxID=1452353 RepID=UPI002B25E750|nr:ThiF family adenylyltransferase [Methanosphaera sp. ISO3-F5]WQH65133.1 ThiF family adenylyltransferase [Methanosphaera sp. ISO3-F5]
MTKLYEDLISRQIEIFTQEEQEKLRTTPIVVVGTGGLGGIIVEQFVRAGFETLTIIDQDVFDKTNLNRQLRSNLETIGKSKVKVTKEAAEKINPNVNITAYDLTINQHNISEIFKGNEILVDAVDNVYTRVMISREAKKQGMTFVHSAVDKTLGQLSVFEPKSPTYEEVFKLKSLGYELDQVKDYLLSLSIKKPQVLGITPAIFGSLEVNETIKYILGKENIVLAPKVLQWDIFDISSFRIIDF